MCKSSAVPVVMIADLIAARLQSGWSDFVLPSGLKNLRGGELSSKVYQNLFAKFLSFESY